MSALSTSAFFFCLLGGRLNDDWKIDYAHDSCSLRLLIIPVQTVA